MTQEGLFDSRGETLTAAAHKGDTCSTRFSARERPGGAGACGAVRGNFHDGEGWWDKEDFV